ncbi:sulfite reductase (NADPH2) flavoprotein [Gracilibacillus halophilus YIM-C55.5]|uniref:assimilatory sulfite reductase (NADPH) n=1 Tax=Gracilibacillus halophilus YIM-C55.5 TaxID=1308866 RepID=N4WD12_9BACI|nr:assimilatory sulfite reductase (NADPH) flavoprotein subunit [Gracilibacillus halophilus]ENH98173.1 sulfite reductase (NADPH2) flavoprotein [Gracilibacillus halophilus YIM-C55.5]
MTLKVENSPFNEKQADLINQLVPNLNSDQRTWLAGYLMGSGSQAGGEETVAPAVETPASRTVTILYGSETGNSQMLAEQLADKTNELNRTTTVSAMDDFKPKKLKEVEDLLIITATHGEGDPPDNAIQFHEFLHSRKAPKLNDVKFAVLSLGDESYDHFCQTGKDFDKRLEELGAERIKPRIDCDVDFDEPAAEWMDGVVEELKQDQPTPSVASASSNQDVPADQPVYTRSNPFAAEVLDNILLSGQGSEKETRHIELSLEGSNLSYEPGDCLAIYPKNDPKLVQQIIDKLDWDAEQSIPINKQGEIRSVQEALTSIFEITRLTKSSIEKAQSYFANDELDALISDAEKVKDYIDGRDLLDLITDYPPNHLKADNIMDFLRKIPARQYSIASSYQANPDEVHLTIATVRYHSYGRDRDGVCSGEIADRIEPGDQVNVYVHKNPNFKFPLDEETPVIMVGPGTGVAPFRGYLEEREELELEGKTWLFFGDQHFRTDFLYQVDWQNWLNSGVLSKMDVAFSRDNKEKVYVQNRMQERSKEIYDWLKQGAHFYVCGDEKRMAKDVHQTLLDIIEEEGNLSASEAEAYLNQLKQEKRYQRDVY